MKIGDRVIVTSGIQAGTRGTITGFVPNANQDWSGRITRDGVGDAWVRLDGIVGELAVDLDCLKPESNGPGLNPPYRPV
jgi:hypothetical protein